MTEERIRAAIAKVLAGIAPEADLAAVDSRADLREFLDLDSMDFLHFLVDLNNVLSVDVTESDAAKLFTLEGCLAYLSTRAG